MKPKFLMLALGLLGFTFARANAEPDPYSSTCTKAKKEMEKIGPEIEKELKKAKVEIEKAKAGMKMGCSRLSKSLQVPFMMEVALRAGRRPQAISFIS